MGIKVALVNGFLKLCSYVAKNFIYDFTNTFSLQQHHTGGHCFLSLLFKSANCMYVKMYACMYRGCATDTDQEANQGGQLAYTIKFNNKFSPAQKFHGSL